MFLLELSTEKDRVFWATLSENHRQKGKTSIGHIINWKSNPVINFLNNLPN